MGPAEELFPVSDFDNWAESYDQEVLAESRFPFDGYQRTLVSVVRLTAAQPGMSVLDLGIGTGNLAALFDQQGCQVWGIDFSEAMLIQAKRKLPRANLILADLRQAFPPELPDTFDRIVSAYAFHHFDLDQKLMLVKQFLAHLKPTGRIVIADISFINQSHLLQVRQIAGGGWEDEFYWLADETILAFEKAGLTVSFSQLSNMSGVFVLQRTRKLCA